MGGRLVYVAAAPSRWGHACVLVCIWSGLVGLFLYLARRTGAAAYLPAGFAHDVCHDRPIVGSVAAAQVRHP